MSTDAATVRTPEEMQELTWRSIDAAFDFVRATAADPAIADNVPDDATLILVHDDDPELASAAIGQGLAAVRRGENAYFLHVARPSEAENLWAQSQQLDRQYEQLREKILAGELTLDKWMTELDALFDRFSSDAVRMATRRSRVRTATLREQSGITPSPALAAIQALTDEMGDALDKGEPSSSLGSSYLDRMIPLLEDYRRELDER